MLNRRSFPGNLVPSGPSSWGSRVHASPSMRMAARCVTPVETMERFGVLLRSPAGRRPRAKMASCGEVLTDVLALGGRKHLSIFALGRLPAGLRSKTQGQRWKGASSRRGRAHRSAPRRRMCGWVNCHLVTHPHILRRGADRCARPRREEAPFHLCPWSPASGAAQCVPQRKERASSALPSRTAIPSSRVMLTVLSVSLIFIGSRQDDN
jgi:hypothetical protein